MRAPLFILALLCVASAAFAGAPLPPKKAESLDALKQKVAAEKARKEELDRQAKQLQDDLSDIKGKLVKTASQLQGSENDMRKLEAQLADLKKKKAEIVSALDTDRKSLSTLIIALERIRRLPPETLLAKPGAPRETAQAATALGAILPELNKRAEALKVKLEELNTVETALARNQSEMKEAFDKLKGEKKEMDTMLAARSRTWSETQKDLQEQQKAVDAASKEAADFQDLIARIEENNRKLQSKREQAARQSGKTPGQDLAESVPLPGAAQLPVSGIVRVRYGQQDDIGASSQGIRIEARPGAVVVAPMGGVVRYAGPFKSYGNIILLEHKNNYHSLIAGLGRIDTVVGQSVDSGEPVGSLGSEAGERPVLYYELRLNGEPINPARKFSDLGT